MAERLRAAVKASGMSMREASEKAGLGPNFLSQMLTIDGRSPSVDNLIAIARVLGVSPLYLHTGLNVSEKAERNLARLSTAGPEVLDEILALATRLLNQQEQGDDRGRIKPARADPEKAE